MTAFSPGQSPPPVSIPTRMCATTAGPGPYCPIAVACCDRTDRDRHRRRHDRRARLRRRRAGHDRRLVATGSSRSTSRSPGWVEHDADEIWAAVAGHAGRARRPTLDRARRRDRHHQPARDGRRVGPPHRRAAATAPSCGRTAAPPTAATSSRDAGHLPLVRATHRPRARPVLLGHQARVAARPRAASRPTPTSPSAPSTRGCSGTSPAAAGARHRRRRTPAARCCTTSATLAWSDELCDAVRRADARACPRCARRAAGSASPPTTPAAGAASRSAASPATSRPRCSARRASSRA